MPDWGDVAQIETGQPVVARDLMLISVAAPPEKRPEVYALIDMFRGRVVDIGQKSVMVEGSGPEAKIEGFIDVCKPYGIKSLAQTGTIAMPIRSKTE